MLIDYIRQIQASQKFSISDEFKFIEFDDLSRENLKPEEDPEDLDIWAGVRISYTGQIPDSYRTLNYIIGEWVDRHRDQLTEVIHEQLKGHARLYYEGSEVELEDTAIWEEQLDYMPRIDPEKKTIMLDIELVLEMESMEDEPDGNEVDRG